MQDKISPRYSILNKVCHFPINAFIEEVFEKYGDVEAELYYKQ
jgi:hypothetical protein